MDIKYFWLISSLLLILGSAIGKDTVIGDALLLIAWGFLLTGLWKNERMRRLSKKSNT